MVVADHSGTGKESCIAGDVRPTVMQVQMAAHEDAVREARQVLGGKELKPEELLKLAKALKRTNEFGYAWRILARARKLGDVAPNLRTVLRQEQALCTYKDTHLHEDLNRTGFAGGSNS